VPSERLSVIHMQYTHGHTKMEAMADSDCTSTLQPNMGITAPMPDRVDPNYEHDLKLTQVVRTGAQPDFVAQYYDQWADTFESDMELDTYAVPNITLREMEAQFGDDRDIRILDCGSGTGIMAEKLQKEGFTNIDALDPSQGMLDMAAKKNIYTNFYCDFLGTNRLPIQNDTYDACVLVGCLIPGHVKPDCFEELIRITKPGGKIVMLTREFYLRDDPELRHVEPRIESLRHSGHLKLLKREIIEGYYKTDSGIVLVCQVL